VPRVSRQFSLGDVWGQRVAARREELGLTQAQLAELAQIKQQTVSKIERGEVVPLDALKVVLADALGTHPWRLFPWPGQTKSKVPA
jgi:transcriptional regulator with XRE-family HTH domain